MLFPDDVDFGCHLDPIGGFSEEDIKIYLKFYADDEIRERWRKDFPEDVIPDKDTPPYDRDRFLPTHEERAFGTQIH